MFRLSKRLLVGLLCTISVPPINAQDYRSSVVGTEFDYILDSDSSTFHCLEFKGRHDREMPDKTVPEKLVQPAFVFVSHYTDGTQIDMAIDTAFGSAKAAQAEAMRYVPRLGKLPTLLRKGVKRLVVHKGEVDTTAFSDVGLIVVYSDNATKRISTHDLEETIFHESVHAALDKLYARSPEWLKAQSADNGYVTDYARKNREREDLAESALFAYTLLHHPERIPVQEAKRIASTIPARIEFVETLLPLDKPIFYPVGPKHICDDAQSLKNFAQSTDVVGASRLLQPIAEDVCDVDISKIGQLSDILSNALMRGLRQDEDTVKKFLEDAQIRCTTADELIQATAAEFKFETKTLNAQVQKYLHCNCRHAEIIEPDSNVLNSVETQVLSPAKIAVTTPLKPTTSQAAILADLATNLRLIAGLLCALLLVNAVTLFLVVRSRTQGET